MGILANLGDAANGCKADADTPQGQDTATGAVEDSKGGKVRRSGPGLGPRASRSGVEEGEPPRENRPGQ